MDPRGWLRVAWQTMVSSCLRRPFLLMLRRRWFFVKCRVCHSYCGMVLEEFDLLGQALEDLGVLSQESRLMLAPGSGNSACVKIH